MTELDELRALRELREEITRFRMVYRFALDEMMTKINILKGEVSHTHDYSPFEHVTFRLKSPESILSKAIRKGYPLSMDQIRENVWDIAGVRIACSFISDAYRIAEMLTSQQDLELVAVNDYIEHPKPNGYQSLHLIFTIPVFMSDRVETVHVEVQIRTVAMDFWATLEHKIHYKYQGEVPEELLAELKQTAEVAGRLDLRMEHLHDQVVRRRSPSAPAEGTVWLDELQELPLREGLLEAFLRGGLPPRGADPA